jgi:hypothetical protein
VLIKIWQTGRKKEILKKKKKSRKKEREELGSERQEN